MWFEVFSLAFHAKAYVLKSWFLVVGTLEW